MMQRRQDGIGRPPSKGTASMPKLYESPREAFLWRREVDTQFVLMGDGNSLVHAFAKLPWRTYRSTSGTSTLP